MIDAHILVISNSLCDGKAAKRAAELEEKSRQKALEIQNRIEEVSQRKCTLLIFGTTVAVCLAM